MSVSVDDYYNTNVIKSFDSVDDLVKSDYYRFVHGKKQHVHDSRIKHYTVCYRIGSSEIMRREVAESELVKFGSESWSAGSKWLKELNPEAKLVAVAGTH